MRRLVVPLLLLCMTSSARAADVSLQLRWLGDWGTYGLNVNDATPWMARATPYQANAIDLIGELESKPDDRTMLGTPLQIRGRLLLGWRTNDPRADVGGGARVMLSGGTLIPFFRTTKLSVLGHVTSDIWIYEPQFGFFITALYGGARVDYLMERGETEIRLRAQYDAKPFWFRTDRVEHELTLRAIFGHFGLRVSGMIGQQKSKEGGYPDKTLAVGVEALW